MSTLTIDKKGAGAQDTADLGPGNGFPIAMCLIHVREDLYACNNATTPGPEGSVINGLACFPDEEEARIYMQALNGLNGSIVTKSFEEARAIAVSKPVLSALLLMRGAKVREVHYVR